MRSMILMGCLCLLCMALYGQGSSRVRSGTPLRWGMNGSIEVMEGDLAQYYGSNDTVAGIRRYRGNTGSALSGNPHATRFASVQTQCDNNAMLLQWVAVQQYNVDRYEIEQSTDGGFKWVVVGSVPANRTDFGEASYQFNYYREAGNTIFRIAAVTTGGERLLSSSFESPCSSTTYLAITPNPVYSTTTVRMGSPSAAKVKLLVLDSKGMIVLNSDASLTAGINHLPLNLSHLPGGYYTVAIRWITGKQEILKLVKQ